MRAYLTGAVAACLGLAAGPGLAQTAPAPPTAAASPAPVLVAPAPALQALETAIDQALAKEAADDKAGALAAFEAAAASPAFARLSARRRYEVYGHAGLLAYELDRDALAHDMARKATAMDLAGNQAWRFRLRAASAADDMDDAIETLRRLALRGAAGLETLPDEWIFELVRDAEKRPNGAEVRFRLTQALFDSGWKPDRGVWDQPSIIWRDLALDYIQRGQMDKAKAAAARVLNAYAVMSMHADRRFDPLVRAEPGSYALEQAIERELAEYRARSAAQPNSLKARNALAMRLLSRNRLDEALAVLDEGLALASPAAGKNALASDADELNWSLDVRAQVLRAAGRNAEALAVYEKAAAAPERGDANVSQTLNLAAEYVSQGRPREALATAERMGKASVYGQSVQAMARACAYAQLGDRASAAKALAILRRNRDDAPGPLTHALLCTNDLDGAAAHHVAALADPDLRFSMLGRIQDYRFEDSQTAYDKEMRRRLRLVLARPEVKAAIDKVGRIVPVDLMD